MSEFGIGCLHIDGASLPNTTRHDQDAIFANAGQWIVQGGGDTNPVNNQHLRVKNSEAVPDPTSADAKNTVPLDMGSEKPVLAKLHTDIFTLDDWKCYLDICATYHTFFVREFLDIVSSGKTAINGICNAGTVTTNTRGWYRKFKVWLNERGVANLLSIPILEYSWYIVSTHTKGDWFVTTPKVMKVIFKRGT